MLADPTPVHRSAYRLHAHSGLLVMQEHVTRICRIIQRPSGNAMLIGVGGSGKQSLSRLAAFICGFEVRQLSVTSKFKVRRDSQCCSYYSHRTSCIESRRLKRCHRYKYNRGIILCLFTPNPEQ